MLKYASLPRLEYSTARWPLDSAPSDSPASLFSFPGDHQQFAVLRRGIRSVLEFFRPARTASDLAYNRAETVPGVAPADRADGAVRRHWSAQGPGPGPDSDGVRNSVHCWG